MPRILTSADRSALIRLASNLEKGSDERRTILARLARASDTPDFNRPDSRRDDRYKMWWAAKAFDKIPGFKKEYSKYATVGVLEDPSTFPSWVLPFWERGEVHVTITAYLHNSHGGSVSIRASLEGYRDDAIGEENFLTFEYVDGKRVAVKDPVQSVYRAAEKALKNFQRTSAPSK